MLKDSEPDSVKSGARHYGVTLLASWVLSTHSREMAHMTDGLLEKVAHVVVEERVVDVPAVTSARDQAEVAKQAKVV